MQLTSDFRMTVYRLVEDSGSNTARKQNASEQDRYASSLVFPTIFQRILAECIFEPNQIGSHFKLWI